MNSQDYYLLISIKLSMYSIKSITEEIIRVRVPAQIAWLGFNRIYKGDDSF